MKATLQGLLVGFIVKDEDYLPKGDIILNAAESKAKLGEYIQKGENLTVSHIGEGVTFVKLGDKIALASNARASQFPNPEGGVFHIIREADIAFKITE